jgi:hypothetical protein
VLVHASRHFDGNNVDFPACEAASMRNNPDNFHVGIEVDSSLITAPS